MKKIRTTAIEISASVSCTRVEICTPKYRTANSPSAKIVSHSQIGRSMLISRTGSRLSCTYPPISSPSPVVRMMVPP